MDKQRRLRGITILSVVAASAGMLFVAPGAALAAPPSSDITVSTTSLQRGETFTVTETLYNPQDFTVVGAKAALYGKETPITDVVDVVSCDVACGVLGSSLRAGVGDLAPGASATVAFTLKVKDTAPAGSVTLQDQFVGDNFSFETLDGPAVTVTPATDSADIGVSLAAAPTGVLSSEITYTITAKNTGPATATGVKLQATLPSGLQYSKSSSCTASGRTVTCTIASLPANGTAKASFSARAGLLTIGTLTTTAQRQASSPTDPNAANDKASRSCHAVTSLLISC
ncbi:DUF11 domain-containing protein [Amycolatopsis rhabdoformis]|uniref:DUF11 domain-containing protein n=1 Tax=Amycolatopsis rhabdoformis TaxID=1448059 RepID=A0ABZ1I5R8_9PSEU|nr:DUF11 domain-containing protein [Amycolatopsis rhabdoformis]WSE29774.1 DUF11 domain-containing protein [Amycolatopsis rhabdoformis]